MSPKKFMLQSLNLNILQVAYLLTFKTAIKMSCIVSLIWALKFATTSTFYLHENFWQRPGTFGRALRVVPGVHVRRQRAFGEVAPVALPRGNLAQPQAKEPTFVPLGGSQGEEMLSERRQGCVATPCGAAWCGCLYTRT
jgi:uncharacterized membrane protein